MIGELFNAMMKETFDDPENRSNAALPYLFAKHAGGLQATGMTMSAMTAPAPSAPAFRM